VRSSTRGNHRTAAAGARSSWPRWPRIRRPWRGYGDRPPRIPDGDTTADEVVGADPLGHRRAGTGGRCTSAPKGPEGQLVTWDLRERRRHEKPTGCHAAGPGRGVGGPERWRSGHCRGDRRPPDRRPLQKPRRPLGVMLPRRGLGRAAPSSRWRSRRSSSATRPTTAATKQSSQLKSAWKALRTRTRTGSRVHAAHHRRASRKGSPARQPIGQQWKEDRCAPVPTRLTPVVAGAVVAGLFSRAGHDASVHPAWRAAAGAVDRGPSLAGWPLMMDTDLLAGPGVADSPLACHPVPVYRGQEHVRSPSVTKTLGDPMRASRSACAAPRRCSPGSRSEVATRDDVRRRVRRAQRAARRSPGACVVKTLRTPPRRRDAEQTESRNGLGELVEAAAAATRDRLWPAGDRVHRRASRGGRRALRAEAVK
jgi:hypothetical protein